MLTKSAKVHFIGIGGIGMSALAQILLSKGYIVTGSDVKKNNLTDTIESKGGKVFEGHQLENVRDAQVVIYSSSIAKENPELTEARRRGLQVMHRGQLLAEVMKDKTGVAITGAHGKTTTTAMISNILIKAGYDPMCILGGESLNLKSNVYLGKGKFIVAEADESDGSHLYLEPSFGIMTNIDHEHLDYYDSIDDIVKAGKLFMERISQNGVFFGSMDDKFVRKLLVHYKGRFATFGMSQDADLYAANVRLEGLSSQFDCMYDKRKIGTIKMKVPGMHNVLNALASILFALHIGIGFDTIRESLYDFKSTKRRFEIFPDTGRVLLIEDYAHHPTEIMATLQACRLLRPKRIVAVFQPHRYTRTQRLQREFGNCFGLSDELILTNIYPASEAPIEGVTVRCIFDKVLDSGLSNVHIMPKKNIAEYLYNTACDGDLIAVLGAGDIGEVAGELRLKLAKDEG